MARRLLTVKCKLTTIKRSLKHVAVAFATLGVICLLWLSGTLGPSMAEPAESQRRSSSRPTASEASAQQAEPAGAPRSDTTEYLNRDEVQALLRDLAESPPPTNLSRGGCFSPSMPPDTVFYVCPRCDRTTPHADNSIKWFIWDKLRPSRRIVSEVTKIFVVLDEKGFCRACDSRKTTPEVCLLIRCRGQEEPHRTCGISREEVTLVSEFLQGEKKHTTRTGRQTSLKFYLRKLEELLGVTAYADTSGSKDSE